MSYIKKKSKAQEKRTAKEFGGKVTPASGALDGAKGDVRTSSFLIENKFTDKDYYTFNVKTWNKIYKEAIKDSLRMPLMQVDIQDLQLVVVDLYDFEETEAGKELKEILHIDIDTLSIKILKRTFDIFEVVICNFRNSPYNPVAFVRKDLFIDGIA